MNRGGGGGPPGRGGFQGGGGRRSPPPRQPPGPGGYGGPPGPGPVGYGGPAGPGGPPPPRVDLGMVPPGIDLPRGENAMDNISRTLADVSPGQMQDVMAGMKVCHLSFVPLLFPQLSILITQASDHCTHRLTIPDPHLDVTRPSTPAAFAKAAARLCAFPGYAAYEHCRPAGPRSECMLPILAVRTDTGEKEEY